MTSGMLVTALLCVVVVAVCFFATWTYETRAPMRVFIGRGVILTFLLHVAWLDGTDVSAILVGCTIVVVLFFPRSAKTK
ncbi:MAG: hypothetical protein FJ091_12090 [Deltaproteobacteria bacterium]|nr:hypothetical protein [Deltaproteobacteria bacterium]